MDDETWKAAALYNFAFTASLFGYLGRKGVLTVEEGRTILDETLLNLEQHQALAGTDERVVQIARLMVERALKAL